MTRGLLEMAATQMVGSRVLKVAAGSVALGLTAMYADIGISFSSQLDSVNEQSDGSPMDASFTFQLGSFDGLTPNASNTHLWNTLESFFR